MTENRPAAVAAIEERRPLGVVPGNTAAASGQTVDGLSQRVHGEFREMPGLCLTLEQAARLFDLPVATCASVLHDLVGRLLLQVRPDGRYAWTGPRIKQRVVATSTSAAWVAGDGDANASDRGDAPFNLSASDQALDKASL